MLLHLRTLLITVGIYMLATPSIAQSFDDGVKAADAGKFGLALEIWAPLAQDGDAKAQTNLGAFLAIGMGAPKDINAALHWLCLAAYQGDNNAQLSLGTLLSEGAQVERDYDAAAYWFLKAAQQDNAIARVSYRDLLSAGLTTYEGNEAYTQQKICNIGPASHDIATLLMPPYWINSDQAETQIEPMGPMFDERLLETLAWGGKSPAKTKVFDPETKQISTVDNSQDFTFAPELVHKTNGTTQCSLMRYSVIFPEFDGNPLRKVLESQMLTSNSETKTHHYFLGQDFQIVEYQSARNGLNIWVWSWAHTATPNLVHGIALRAVNNGPIGCDTERLVASLKINHPGGQNWNATQNSRPNATPMVNASGIHIMMDVNMMFQFGLDESQLMSKLRASIDSFDFSSHEVFDPTLATFTGRSVRLTDFALQRPVGKAPTFQEISQNNPWHSVFLEFLHDCTWDERTLRLLSSAVENGLSPLSECR